MALRVLRGISRRAGRYVAACSWNASAARTLTVSTARLAAEKAKVTHTGQVSIEFLCPFPNYVLELKLSDLIHRYGKRVITEIYGLLIGKNR